MRTAETIVKEYLERGYSLESLRLLAESRPEPMRSALLALVAGLRDQTAAAIAGQAGAEDQADTGEESVVFLADATEPTAGDEEAVDIMADIASSEADADESVADIFIGETDGSEMVSLKPLPTMLGGFAESDPGLIAWRLSWSEKTQDGGDETDLESPVLENGFGEEPPAPAVGAKTGAVETDDRLEVAAVAANSVNSVDYLPGTVPDATLEENLPEDDCSAAANDGSDARSAGAEVLEAERSNELMEAEACRNADHEPSATSQGEDFLEDRETDEMEANILQDDEPSGDCSVLARGSAMSGGSEPALTAEGADDSAPALEAVVADAVADEGLVPVSAGEMTAEENNQPAAVEETTPEDAATAVSSDGDGQPLGEVSEARSEAAQADAPEATDAPASPTVAEAALPAVSNPLESAAAAEVPLPAERAVTSGAFPATESQPQTRKERRKRVKAERKKKKAERHLAPSADALPEIVLARREGTDTLLPENKDSDAVSAAATANAEMTTPDGETSMISAAAEEQPAAPRQPVTDIPAQQRHDYRPEGKGSDFADAGDHCMIIAGGGLDLRSDVVRSVEEMDDEDALAESSNVILFHVDAPYFDDEDDGAVDFAGENPSPLRMLPVVSEDEETDAPEGDCSLTVTERTVALSPLARYGLLRAMNGPAGLDEPVVEEEPIRGGGDHVIVSEAVLDADTLQAEKTAEVQAEVEREYQERLDEFARRLLESQAAAAESELRAREMLATVAGKEAELESMARKLAAEAEKQAELASQVSLARREAASKDGEISRFRGLQEEHERLYNEFEDLRKAYNEVVSDVMPGLQTERDELALTVERQTEEFETLKFSTRATRRRLAVGYAMSAAAVVMVVALTTFNWRRSDDQSKSEMITLADFTQQCELLDRAQVQNVEDERTIVDLQRQLELARVELARLEERTGGSTRLVDQRARELARNNGVRSGTPSRTTSNLALQGGNGSNGQLRVNEIRDPGGQIDQTVVANRSRRQMGDEDQFAAGGQPVNELRPPAAGSSRPAAGSSERIPVRTVAVQPNAGTRPADSRPTATAASRAREGEVTATVRASEGVAQVVYRVLGTRDPEVIDWVIRENNIKKNRKGNPIIHPNQELRLPQNGRVTQAASR
ncbi:MAG: hypothetical protein LIP77_01385 [Planctomycetes bacterium]|nr:hypothetical protein [Planctomycetota bacterium]